MVSIIMYYNITILWDNRRICGPSLTETSLCGAYLYICPTYDYVFSLQMAFIPPTLATLLILGPGLPLDLTMRAGLLQWHGRNAMSLQPSEVDGASGYLHSWEVATSSTRGVSGWVQTGAGLDATVKSIIPVFVRDQTSLLQYKHYIY